MGRELRIHLFTREAVDASVQAGKVPALMDLILELGTQLINESIKKKIPGNNKKQRRVRQGNGIEIEQ